MNITQKTLAFDLYSDINQIAGQPTGLKTSNLSNDDKNKINLLYLQQHNLRLGEKNPSDQQPYLL